MQMYLMTASHPIFGSNAGFFESDCGKAKIDLAKIPKSRVFDTHTVTAMDKIHQVKLPVPEMSFKDGDDAYERNAAARDAMRTRELVIAGSIPKEAVEEVDALAGTVRRGYVKDADGLFKKPVI